jgi:hypothetical protein
MPKAKKKKTGTKAEDANYKYPWLTNKQVKVMGMGGYFDEEGALHNEDGCIRCTSIIRSTQKRCKNFAVPGELYCNCHGGVSGRKALGKERMYSAMIQDPTLKAIYDHGQQDDTIRGVREELGLLRALLGKVILQSTDMSIKELKGLSGVIGEIRQLVDGCTKAEIKMGQLIELSKIGEIVQKLAEIVHKYVEDESVLLAIANEFDQLIIPATFASTPQPEARTPVRKVPRISGEIRD